MFRTMYSNICSFPSFPSRRRLKTVDSEHGGRRGLFSVVRLPDIKRKSRETKDPGPSFHVKFSLSPGARS